MQKIPKPNKTNKQQQQNQPKTEEDLSEIILKKILWKLIKLIN